MKDECEMGIDGYEWGFAPFAQFFPGYIFLFTIVHALYHVHMQSYFVSIPAHSSCNLILAPNIMYVRGMSFQGGGGQSCF